MIRMQRLIAALVVALMMTAGTAFATEEADRALITRSAEMAITMARLAQSPYVVLMTENEEMLDLIARMGMQAYDAPEEAVVLRLDSQTLLDAAAAEFGLGDEAWDESLSAIWRQRILTTMPSMLSSLSGSIGLAAASVVSISESFVSELPLDGTIVCLLYGDDAEWMVAVAFFTGGDGIVTGHAMPAQMTDELRTLIGEGGLMTLEALAGVTVDGTEYAGAALDEMLSRQ